MKPSEEYMDLSALNMDFLLMVNNELKAALKAHVGDDDENEGEFGSGLFAQFVEVVSREMSYWILVEIPREPERWESHLRVLTALRKAVDDHLIVFKNIEDIELFQLIIYTDFVIYPFVIEHYVQTGEFIEALWRIAGKKSDRALLMNSDGTPGTAHLVVFRVKMLRLYAYDTQKERERVGLGLGLGDTVVNGSIASIPLDVRLVFSGFDEDVSIAENVWDFRMRTKKVPTTEEDILSSFQVSSQEEKPSDQS